MVDPLGIELVASVLEELVQYGLLLVIVDVHAFALYSTTLNSNSHIQL